MPHLDDAADELPAPSTILGFSVDPTWREVNRYQPTCDSGHEAIVSVARMPARFWRIHCPDLDLDMGTGSGREMGGLADSIAKAIADGMLAPTADE
jgi:hypothetical protein